MPRLTKREWYLVNCACHCLYDSLDVTNGEIKDRRPDIYTEEAEQFISEVEMTKYEELMNKSDECCLKAIEFARKCDWNMATFYKNASIGFKEKALKLNVSY